jgi:hypothetical protein
VRSRNQKSPQHAVFYGHLLPHSSFSALYSVIDYNVSIFFFFLFQLNAHNMLNTYIQWGYIQWGMLQRKMLQRTNAKRRVFVNKIRMLQRTRRNNIGRRNTLVPMTCSIIVFIIKDFLCFSCALDCLCFLLGKVCS